MAPDPAHLDDPFDTSAELLAEAAAMEARAAQQRADSLSARGAAMTPLAIDNDVQRRAQKLATQEAELARSDAKDSRGRSVASLDEHSELLSKADGLEAAGDAAGAQELREDAADALEFAQRQATQATASEVAAAAADARATTLGAQIDELNATGHASVDTANRQEQRSDEMEQSAVLMRDAAAQMAEAERLDAAAVDLRARGVAGVDRVDAAAKTARDEAEVLVLRAQQKDPSDTYGTTDANGIDPDLIEIEPNTDTSATDASGIDPDLIEIEPNTDTSATEAPQSIRAVDDDPLGTDGMQPDDEELRADAADATALLADAIETYDDGGTVDGGTVVDDTAWLDDTSTQTAVGSVAAPVDDFTPVQSFDAGLDSGADASNSYDESATYADEADAGDGVEFDA